MSNPYDWSKFWVKAKLFINHAMDDEDPRTFDERALWAAFALELLAKAALARVSPLLIAAPSEDGSNLLIASGLAQGDGRFGSVAARTLYVRCSRAFPPFSKDEAITITNSRNEYVHGPGVGFYVLPEAVWWPRFWAQTAVLVNALDQPLAELVGDDRVAVVEGHLAQNRQNVVHRTEMLLQRAVQRLRLMESGTAPAALHATLAQPLDLSAGFSHRTAQECPACQGQGLLEGDFVQSAEVHYEQIDEDDYDAWMDLQVSADRFSCDNCRLVLDGQDYLAQAGLPTSFGDIGELGDYIEPEYGND